MRMRSPSSLCTLPPLPLERQHVPFRLRQENKALPSLSHSSPLPPVRERERRAACVVKRKDNVILLYGCYDYDYYFIIIIFYSGFYLHTHSLIFVGFFLLVLLLLLLILFLFISSIRRVAMFVKTAGGRGNKNVLRMKTLPLT